MKRKKTKERKWNRWVSAMSRAYDHNREVKKYEIEKAEEIAVIFILSIWVITWIALVTFLLS